MDGNRRYAQNRLQAEKHEGHSHGLQKLIDTMEWCLQLGISEVSVFALAIDNLKRSQKEVDVLFSLVKNSFKKFANEREFFVRNDVRVRILGRINLLPEDVQEPLYDVMEETQNNKSGTINIYICYNSVQEFIDCAHKCREECKETGAEYSDEMFESNFYGGKISPQILIRTSNEVRLSNFMLFQGKN